MAKVSRNLLNHLAEVPAVSFLQHEFRRGYAIPVASIPATVAAVQQDSPISLEEVGAVIASAVRAWAVLVQLADLHAERGQNVWPAS